LNEYSIITFAVVAIVLASVYTDYVYPTPAISVKDVQLYESGYAVIHIMNAGSAPDNLKAVLLEYNNVAHAGLIVNASDVVPARGDAWVLVKFDRVMPANATATLVLVFERNGRISVEVKPAPFNLVPANYG